MTEDTNAADAARYRWLMGSPTSSLWKRLTMKPYPNKQETDALIDDDMKPWLRTTQYGRADLTKHTLVRAAYKVACLIERCGASPELTEASSAAFELVERLHDEFKSLQGLIDEKGG